MQWLMFNACSTELAVSSRPNEACRHTAEGLLPFFGWGRRGRKLGEGREEEWGLVLSVSKLGPVTSQGPKHVLSSSFSECVCVCLLEQCWLLVCWLCFLWNGLWLWEREKYKRVKVVLKNSLLDSLMSSSHYCTILLYHFYADFSLTLYIISLCGRFLIILISYISDVICNHKQAWNY